MKGFNILTMEVADVGAAAVNGCAIHHDDGACNGDDACEKVKVAGAVGVVVAVAKLL